MFYIKASNYINNAVLAYASHNAVMHTCVYVYRYIYIHV